MHGKKHQEEADQWQLSGEMDHLKLEHQVEFLDHEPIHVDLSVRVTVVTYLG